MEKLLSTSEVENGTIQLWSIEGLFFVKAEVKGLVKFSEALTKADADFLIFDAINYNCFDF